jgi:hypothetical protein
MNDLPKLRELLASHGDEIKRMFRTLSERSMLELYVKMPPTVNQCEKMKEWTEIESIFIAEDLINKDPTQFIADAVKNNDTAKLEKIAKISKHINDPQYNKFSNSVIFALLAKLKLEKNKGRLPTKGDVIREAEKLAKSENRQCFSYYGDNTRWTEVFRVASLSYLPKSHSKRGASRRSK